MRYERMLERIHSKIVKDGLCWRWTGKSTLRGLHHRRNYNRPQTTLLKPYGVITFEGRQHYVHRFLFPKPVPEKLHQICDTPLCVNPAHWSPQHD